MAIDMQLVKLHGYTFPDFQFTYTLTSGLVAADRGGPVTRDHTAANSMKKGADNTPLDGILLSLEDRTQEGTLVGAVARKFAVKLPIKAADALAVGDTPICAGGGEVRKWISGTDAALKPGYGPEVVEVSGGFATILVF